MSRIYVPTLWVREGPGSAHQTRGKKVNVLCFCIPCSRCRAVIGPQGVLCFCLRAVLCTHLEVSVSFLGKSSSPVLLSSFLGRSLGARAVVFIMDEFLSFFFLCHLLVSFFRKMAEFF